MYITEWRKETQNPTIQKNFQAHLQDMMHWLRHATVVPPFCLFSQTLWSMDFACCLHATFLEILVIQADFDVMKQLLKSTYHFYKQLSLLKSVKFLNRSYITLDHSKIFSNNFMSVIQAKSIEILWLFCV